MKKSYRIVFFTQKTLLWSFILCLSTDTFAQKKGNDNSILSPSNSGVISVKVDNIRRKIVADWRGETEFTAAINNGINRQLLLSADTKLKFEKENPRIGFFYISKEKLIELLYEDPITQGFNIFFTKYNNEIVLVRADGKYNNTNNKFEYLNTSGKPASSTIVSIKNSTLPQIRAGFKHNIKSYFIGRQCIMRNFTTNEGEFTDETVGVRMDVRANKIKQYSIIFTLVNRDKSTQFLGVATVEPSRNIVPIGGGASSRPCPTHCPEE